MSAAIHVEHEESVTGSARIEGDDVVLNTSFRFHGKVVGKMLGRVVFSIPFDLSGESTHRWNYRQANCSNVNETIGVLRVRVRPCYEGVAVVLYDIRICADLDKIGDYCVDLPPVTIPITG